ncbi:MAG: helix-turn-helix domain-containing protein [Bacteroidales bacterium]|nr:helix-turn-helix domain-containing protein [Bacteroidales bacterium]
MQSIGETITTRRKELKITQRQLSELASVGYNTLIAVEKGQGNPTLSVLQRILDTLGLRIIVTVKDYEES